MPFSLTRTPSAPISLNLSTPMVPAVNWLLRQGHTISSSLPRFPTASSDSATFFGGTNLVPSGFTPPIESDQRSHRRRPFRMRVPASFWTSCPSTKPLSFQGDASPQNLGKVVSITNADPTGGSTIVTRRRQDGRLDVRVVYSREFIVAASASPYALLPPPNYREMVLEMLEIVAKFPTSYSNSIRNDTATTNSES